MCVFSMNTALRNSESVSPFFFDVERIMKLYSHFNMIWSDYFILDVAFLMEKKCQWMASFSYCCKVKLELKLEFIHYTLLDVRL